MAENKLPSGVGKKIVQALKKQAEIEINPISEDISNNNFSMDNTSDLFDNNVTENVSISDDFSGFSQNNQNVEFFDDSVDELSTDNFPNNDFNVNNSFNSNSGFDGFDPVSFNSAVSAPSFDAQPAPRPIPQHQTYTMPSNVAVLKRLIMQLPSGVTKQTGAQIIRQTMEALGISMSSVLKEAQQVQDGLSRSEKECLSTINEYKNNILSLEKQMQDYRKQAVALNDLISLFVMTDK